MKVTTHLVSDYQYNNINESGNELPMDMYPAGEKEAFSPTQALLGALASCAAVDIVQMMKKKRWQVDDLVIETVGTRRDENPKYFTAITQTFKLVSPDADEEGFRKSVMLAVDKYCSVASTLRDDINVTIVTEVHRQPIR